MSAKARPKIDAESSHEATTPQPEGKGTTFMDRLMKIQFDGPEDLASNFDLYVSGVKSAKADLR